MSLHRALLLDADDDFLALLKQSLEPCGFSVLQVRDPEAPLERILVDPPDLIFISVEPPDKEGFRVFTRVRGLARRVPIAMVTASLSATEMSLHAKLRLHADLYLNKRALDVALLLRTLLPLLPDVPGLAGEASRHVPMRSLPDGTGSIPEWLSAPDDGEVQIVLAGFPAEEAPGAGDLAGASVGELHHRIAGLESECERLRNELAQARHDASSSPFSSDVALQREEISRYNAELSRLQFEVGHRERLLGEARSALGGQAEQLDRALRERSEVLARFAHLEEELEEARQELSRLGRERVASEQARAAERAGAQKELAELRQRHERALLETQLELEQLHSALHDLEGRAQSAQRGHDEEVEELRADKEQALARLAKSWMGRLELAEREHAALLQSERERSADERRALESSHRAGLARAEREAEAALAGAVGDLQSRAEARLEEVRRAHRDEVAAQRHQQDDELQKLEASHREALGRMELERESAIRRALADQEAATGEALRELESAHSKQLASLREQHERERQKREADHAAAIEQKEAELAAAAQQAVRGLRAELEQQLAQAQGDHDEAVASLQREHAKERRELERRQEASRTARRDAEAMLAEMRRVAAAHSAELETLKAALSEARQETVERASALASAERELADRAATILSLEALVEDLQCGMSVGRESHAGEGTPRR